MTRARFLLRDQRGFALLATFLVFVLLLTLGSSGLVYSVLDMKSTTHYDTGNQAFAAAESGILHALSTMNTPGVVNFQSDIVQRWSQLYGSALKTIPSTPSVSYQVAVTADAADPIGRGRITATGFAPLQAQRVLAVTLRRGNFNGAQGAIYLAADSVTSQFSGNAFEVNGNDHNISGNLVPGGVVKPGISTRNDTVTNGVVSSLNDNQKDNVQGAGFSLSPLTPSVLTTGGSSVDDLDQIVANLLALPGVVTTNQSDFNGNATFGTVDAPQITRMTNPNVRLNGNASGAGILIADGSVTINGTLDFVGWIIVRGATVINSGGSASDNTVVLGNATILGSLWTGHLDIRVGGSAIVDYCDACMRLADTTGNTSGNLPRPMTVVSWEETF